VRVVAENLWKSRGGKTLIAIQVYMEHYGLSTRTTKFAHSVYPNLYERMGQDPQGFNVLYEPDNSGLAVFRSDQLKLSIDQIKAYALAHPDVSIRMPLPIRNSIKKPKNVNEIFDALSVLPDNVIVVSRI